MATWPSTLPQYLEQDGFSIQQQDQTLRSPTDAGPVKVRRMFSAAVSKVQGQVTITPEQYTTLIDFFNNDCHGGSIPFEWIHPITQATVNFRFKQPPAIASKTGKYFTVKLDLEILP